MPLIEEHVLIEAMPLNVWSLLANPSGWPRWSSVFVDAHGPSSGIHEGSPFSFSLSIIGVRFNVEPTIETAEESSRLVWSGKKFGVRSRHEFLLVPEGGSTRLESRERLWGLPTYLPGFPLETLKKLTRTMLLDLKYAAESAQRVS